MIPKVAVVKWKTGGLTVGFLDGETATHIRLGLCFDGCMVDAIRQIGRDQIESITTLEAVQSDSAGNGHGE
jgi:hypothetical protein